MTNMQDGMDLGTASSEQDSKESGITEYGITFRIPKIS